MSGVDLEYVAEQAIPSSAEMPRDGMGALFTSLSGGVGRAGSRVRRS